ncbi:EAL domain-containing protein [Nitratireductor mangrovi]|uniref:EAL domain-containing protein n=1 Tax=Nitratireductor mangrovi TaxID=2599600 RepID=A0A5B8KXL1_9HYPH|nr:bifunctional diguanylate cyclase/phosphodiesterase [Nitratireductor mangrovi]QDZ00246.1 EAL domain-containing protein [Nitratireductor mangrovi]
MGFVSVSAGIATALRDGAPLSLGGLGLSSERVATALSHIVTHHAAPRRAGSVSAPEQPDEVAVRAMLDLLPTPVYATDITGRITYFNKAAVTFAGREPKLGVDRWCITKQLYRSDGAPLAHEDCPMAQAIREERPVRGAEAIAERPDGTRVPFAPFPTPIHDSSGRLIGAVNVLLDISARKQAEREAARLARHDPLTDLPNRAAFSDFLSNLLTEREGSRRPFAVMKVDLVGHGHITDMFGHAAGDEAMKAIAARLREAGGNATLFHIAADTFAFVIRTPRGRKELRRFAEKLCTAAAAGTRKPGDRRQSIAVGCAVFPADGADGATLLANASSALARARRHAGEPIVFFDADAEMAARDKHTLKNELSDALRTDALTLHYQPQYGRDGAVAAFEALVRWNHPSRGLIAPASFIPLAEEDNTIVEMSEWILRSACREAASWVNPLRIAVNISPVHFRSDTLAVRVATILDECGLPPERLELEITEGVMVHDFEQAMSVLHELRAIGVRIALDDFGTGYSSLSYLQAFPLSTLKIDRSFTANLGRMKHSAAIIRSIVGLGHALELEVAAEGVESQAQLDFLRAEGCDLIQGYFTGRPGDIDTYRALTEACGDQPREDGRGLRSA